MPQPTSVTPPPGLVMLWNSAPAVCSNCQYFCANSFTLPTVAHGKVFLGTDAILPARYNGWRGELPHGRF